LQWYFLGRVCYFCSDDDPPAYASGLAEITGVSHYAWPNLAILSKQFNKFLSLLFGAPVAAPNTEHLQSPTLAAQVISIHPAGFCSL
jgi:hypothetical protein